ncbi:MAG: hypothetical protein GF335_04710 [Candidatus Moranbacteria bacterium]|nr:hypothetical protein [Candidatus Moranbacteria bacterium]
MQVEIDLYNWKNKRLINTDIEVKKDQKYVIQTAFGQFLGKVKKIIQKEKSKKSELSISGQEELPQDRLNNSDYFKIIRKASQEDLELAEKFLDQEKEVLKEVRKKIKDYGLEMKIVGANFSLDESSIVVAFTAESRIDFRELVRDLSHTFKKAVRLEQIGSRDEVRVSGDLGSCGRPLCCGNFNSCKKSINTDMARIQQITHRGNERISGCCGRLMCCLAYELEHYQKISKDIPEIGEKIKISGKNGEVINKKILERKVLIKFGQGDKVEERWYKVDELKK